MLKMQRTLEEKQNFTTDKEMKLFFSKIQYLTFTLQKCTYLIQDMS